MSSQKLITNEESLNDSWVELHFDSSSENSEDTPALSDITDLEKMLLEAQRESSSSSSRTSSHCSSPRRVQTPPLITAQGEVVPESKQEAEACDWSSCPENIPPPEFIIKRPKRTRKCRKHSEYTPAQSEITDLEKILLEAQRESSSSSRTSSHCSSPRRVQTPPLITEQGEVVPESNQEAEAEAFTRIFDWSSRPENIPPTSIITKRPKRTRICSKQSEDIQAQSEILDLEKMLLEAQRESSSSSSRTSSHCSSPRRVQTPPLITAQGEVVPESNQEAEAEAFTRIFDWSSRPENKAPTAIITKHPKRTRICSKQSEDMPTQSEIPDLEKMLPEAQRKSSSSSRTSSHCSSPRRVQTPPLITAQGEVVPESKHEAEAVTICDWSSRPENMPPTAFIIKRPKRTRVCSKNTDKNDTEINKDLLKLLLPSLVLTHILMLGLGICIGRRLANQCSAI